MSPVRRCRDDHLPHMRRPVHPRGPSEVLLHPLSPTGVATPARGPRSARPRQGHHGL